MDLFDTTGFVTRSDCGAWTPLLKSLYIIANLLIAVAYFIIPWILYKVWRARKDLTHSWMLLLFSTFILLCGITHLTEVTVFYWAAYRFYVLIYFLTGVISLITAILLYPIIKSKLRLLTREEYHGMLNNLQVQINQKEILIYQQEEAIKLLTERLNDLEYIKDKNAWFTEQQTFLTDLRTLLRKSNE